MCKHGRKQLPTYTEKGIRVYEEVGTINKRERERERQRRERIRLHRLKLARKAVGLLLLLLIIFACANALQGIDDPSAKSKLPSRFMSEIWESKSPASTVSSLPKTVEDRLMELKEQFPPGSYWNHRGIDIEDGTPTWKIVTDIPCDHSAYGDTYCNRYNGATKEFFPQYDYLTQCLGFSSMLSDQIFGEEAPIRIFRDYNELRVGDQIRLTGSWHSMVVIEKEDDYVCVAECDEDSITCEISWGRKILRSDLAAYGEEIEYITRYED